jgi:hypothetical protein
MLYTVRLDTTRSSASLIRPIGFGALVAPLAATQFAQLRNFNYYFLISIGLSLINTVIVVYVFKFKQQRGMWLSEATRCNTYVPSTLDLIAQYQTSHSSDESESKGRTKELFSNRNVYLLAIFTLTYVGESYLILIRCANQTNGTRRRRGHNWRHDFLLGHSLLN